MKKTTSTKVYWIGIIGLFLLLCFSTLATQIHVLPAVLNAKTLLISRLFFWGIVLLTLLYASKIEKGSLLIWDEVHYTPGKLSLLLLLTILAMYGAGIIGAILTKIAHTNQESEKMVELIPIFKNNPLLLVFTCLTAGVTEEVLIRGYMMPRLGFLLKNPVAAIIISSVLFAILHVGWGTWVQIIAPLFIGLVLAYIYWRYRSMKINIAAHFIFDLMQLILFMNFHK